MIIDIKVYLLMGFYLMGTSQADDFNCPYVDDLETHLCFCYASGQLICDKSEDLPNFGEIDDELKNFKSVHFQNTKIKTINETNLKFKTDEIYIQNNSLLEFIDHSVFSLNAKTIIISENALLNGSQFVESIPENDNVKSIKKLRIRKCKVSEIKSDVFNKMDSLTQLFLEDNELREISETLFKDLRSLTEINLDHNKIQMKPDSFQISSKNILINLNNNQITNEAIKNFKIPSANTTLHLLLENNDITKFTAEPFENLIKDLSEDSIINMKGNKINCIWNDTEWILEHPKLSGQILNVNCDNYHGMDIFRMSQNQFTDKPPPTTEPSIPIKETDRSEQTKAPTTTEPTIPIKETIRSEQTKATPTTKTKTTTTTTTTTTTPSIPTRQADRNEPEPLVPTIPVDRQEHTIKKLK